MGESKVLSFLVLAFALAIGFAVLVGLKIDEKNAALKQQLAETQQQLEQAKAESGKSIFVGSLPDGNYVQCSDKHYALVVREWEFPIGAQGPVYAVHYNSRIPNNFVVKDGKVPDDITK
jgi:hypothetical protein